MKTARELDYSLHHLCIYDDKPRDNMFPYLRWHHGITNFFSGNVFHVTEDVTPTTPLWAAVDAPTRYKLRPRPSSLNMSATGGLTTAGDTTISAG